jgi:hypothetical protein
LFGDSFRHFFAMHLINQVLFIFASAFHNCLSSTPQQSC